MIYGNMIGNGAAPLKTVIIEDADGNQITGVVTGNEVVFTATDNDVREGAVYASDDGISVGTKDIPSYHTSYGSKLVAANTPVIINVDEYDYDNLFIIITAYDTNIAQSTLSTHVSINGCMYVVDNNVKVSNITVDEENEAINLGITVTKKSVIRYLVTREEF